MITHDAVFGRRTVPADNRFKVLTPCFVDKDRKSGLFDGAAEHPTAHQSTVHFQRILGILFSDQHTNDAVIGAAVDKPEMQANCVGFFHYHRRFGFGVPSGRQIELIGLC
jgi:hypothetical protein